MPVLPRDIEKSVGLQPLTACSDRGRLSDVPLDSPGPVGNARERSPGVQTALGHFYNVPKLAVEQRWLRESLLREAQPVLCYSCHASVRAQFALPFHHRVDEGSRKCTDCHNPHGSENLASLTAPGWETCTKLPHGQARTLRVRTCGGTG